MTTTIDRARTARRKAKTLGLKMRQQGNVFTLRDDTHELVMTGGITAVETYLGQRYIAARPGPRAAAIPKAWKALVDGYCLHLAAGGQSAGTIRLRRLAIAHIARGVNNTPGMLTTEQLVSWFGQQTHWREETRRSNRAAIRGFYEWANDNGHAIIDPARKLPSSRLLPPAPKPAPDTAWQTAIARADARVTVMLRLAAEAGLRRAEVAQVHTRDIVDGLGGPQLVVRGKGGKTRRVPLSDSLAALLREGAAGHTPGASPSGWLFPSVAGGHLTAGYVGKLVDRALPDGYTMHSLRHRFATRAYRGSRNLRAVQTLLGHSSIATTERYTAVDDDEIRAAAMAAG